MSASPKPGGPDDQTPPKVDAQKLLRAHRAILDSRKQDSADREAADRLIEKMNPGNGGTGGGPPADSAEKTIHNEKVKLSASWLNSLSLAFLAGSGVTTVLGVGSLPDPNDQLLRGFLWVVAGLALHALARAHLGSLKP